MLIVKMICLAIGTVLAVLFILLTMRGKKEDWRIEGVPEKEFSDKEPVSYTHLTLPTTPYV